MEPERKIEKWLRAYAKKRRCQSGGPFELHPATRRLLQGEIARNASKEDEDDSPSLWRLFRRQWAFFASFAVCIFLGAALFFHSVSTVNKQAEMDSLGISHHEHSEFANTRNFAEQTNSLDAETLAMNNNSAAPQPAVPAEIPKAQKSPVVDQNEMNTQPAPVQPPPPTLAVTTGELAPAQAPPAVEAPPPQVASVNGSLLKAAPATVPPAQSPASAGGEYSRADNAAVPTVVATNYVEPGSVAMNNNSSAPPVVEAPRPRSSWWPIWSSHASTIPASTPPATFETAGIQESVPQNSLPANTGQSYAAAQPMIQQNAFMNTFTPPQNTLVLENFNVQQNGNAIRIVDQDGSVYEGSLRMGYQGVTYGGAQNQQALSGPGQNMSDNTRRALIPQSSTSQGQWQNVQNYFFSAYGMNRTLKQNVLFTGNLLANLPQAGSLPQSFYRNVDQSVHLANGLMKPEAANQAGQLPWSSLRITGRAIINKTNEIQINAAPVPPVKN